MEDHFKKFVDEHRVDFESSSQDFQEMWVQIQKGLKPTTKPIWPSWIRVAASFLILAASTFGLLKYQQNSMIPLELREAEDHYFNIITAKMVVVEAHHEEVGELIWQDLELLDYAYDDLKKDLKEQAHSEHVVQAMIDNYRAKLEILDQILYEIENKQDDHVEALDI
jgi:hypothetical protein